MSGASVKESLEPKPLLTAGAAASPCLRDLLAAVESELEESVILVPEADEAEADTLHSLLTFARNSLFIFLYVCRHEVKNRCILTFFPQFAGLFPFLGSDQRLIPKILMELVFSWWSEASLNLYWS